MFERILVPLDGSPVAEAVLPLVRSLARAVGAAVTLLHALEPSRWAHGQEQAEDYLRPLAGQFAAVGVAADIQVVQGQAADEIVQAAQQGRYALIAMGTGGERALGGFYFGSAAWKVLHRALVPVLLVRSADVRSGEPVELPLRRVLVPLDGSATAEAALPYAEGLAAAFHAELLLVRVVPPPLLLATPGVAPYLGPFQADLLKVAQDYLDTVIRQRGSQPFPVSSVVLTGPVAAQIVGLARQVPDSLVAMATHGRTGVAGLLLGSVAAQVAQHSGDPVLLIRPAANPPPL